LRLIKCQDASEASILCALAGCAFYGIVVSSLWKEDMEQQNQNQQNRHKSTLTTTPIVLSVYKITKIGVDENDDGTSNDDHCLLHLERHENSSDETPKAIVTPTTTGSTTGTSNTSQCCYITASSGGCVICLEPYTAVGELVSVGPLCGHVFHAACLQGWTRRCHASCPSCRQDLQNPDAVSTAAVQSLSNGEHGTASTARVPRVRMYPATPSR
jgi:hypothetical protein